MMKGKFKCLAKSQVLNQINPIIYKKDKDLQHATYSYCVIDAATGKTIKEYNSELALIPASTMKIITTSAALGILGKDFTYKTNFYSIQKKDSLSVNLWRGPSLLNYFKI